MKRNIFIIVVIMLLTNTLSAKCDKWKGEFIKLTYESGKYYKAYKEYKNGVLDKSKFIIEAEDILSEIKDLKDYVNKTESCDGDKYSERKNKLINYIEKALLIMRAGEFIKVFNK